MRPDGGFDDDDDDELIASVIEMDWIVAVAGNRVADKHDPLSWGLIILFTCEIKFSLVLLSG